MLKTDLIKAKQDVEAGNSAIQNAINRYGSLLAEDKRQQFFDFLRLLQPESMGGTHGNGVLNEFTAALQTLIDSTPDGE